MDYRSFEAMKGMCGDVVSVCDSDTVVVAQMNSNVRQKEHSSAVPLIKVVKRSTRSGTLRDDDRVVYIHPLPYLLSATLMRWMMLISCNAYTYVNQIRVYYNILLIANANALLASVQHPHFQKH